MHVIYAQQRLPITISFLFLSPRLCVCICSFCLPLGSIFPFLPVPFAVSVRVWGAIKKCVKTCEELYKLKYDSGGLASKGRKKDEELASQLIDFYLF